MKSEFQKVKEHLAIIFWKWIKRMGITLIVTGIFVLAVMGLQVFGNSLGVPSWSAFLVVMLLCLVASVISHLRMEK